MAISGVGATPEPQKSSQQSVNSQEEKYNSIFEDGIVSTDEQRALFIESINNEESLINNCKKYKVNIGEFFNNFAGLFSNINTDGSQDWTKKAKEEIESRITNFTSKLRMYLINKFTGIEKEPPSVTTEEGFKSEECMNYFVSKIVNMGLKFDPEVFAEIFARADNCQYRESSYISKNDDDYDIFFVDKYMEHDFDGNVKDTHVLDYLANEYADELKNQ